MSDDDRFDDASISRRRFFQLSAATGAALALPGNAAADAEAEAFTAEYQYVLNHTPEAHAVPTLVRFSDSSGPTTMEGLVGGDTDVRTTTEPEPAAYGKLTTTEAQAVADLPSASEFQFSPGSNPFWRIDYYPLGVFPEPRRAVDYTGFEQLKDGLRVLEDRYPDRIRVKNVGKSPGHYNNVTDRPDPKGMYVAELTNFDSETDFEDKEKVFFSCSLHGLEMAGRETGARVLENTARSSEPDVDGSDAKIEPLLNDVVVIMGFTNPDGWAVRNPQYDSGWQLAGPGTGTPRAPAAPLYERGNAEVYDTNRQYPVVGYIDPAHYPAAPASYDGEEPSYVTEKVPDAKALVDFFQEYENLNYGADLHGGPVFNNFVLGLISQDQFDTRQLHEVYEMCLNIDETLETALDTWATAGDIRTSLIGEGQYSPVLFGVLPEEAFDYATIYDTINYTVSGAFLDWMAHPEPIGLDMTTLDFEMSFNHITGGNVYNPELFEMEVTGYRAAIRTITQFAVDNSDTPTTGDTFAVETETGGENVAFVTTGEVGSQADLLRRSSDQLVLSSFESVRDLSYSGVIGPGATGPASTTAEHSFTPKDPDAVRVEATASWGANAQDNELFLEDPDGNRIAGSTNPGGPESITAGIEPGVEYTLVVETYANAASQYEITGSIRKSVRAGDGTSDGGGETTEETTLSEQVAATGTTVATHQVGTDLHSMTVHTHAQDAVLDLELVGPDGEVTYSFDGVTDERVGGKCCGFPEWVVDDPQPGTWTVRVENKRETAQAFDVMFATLAANGSGETETPDPKAAIGYEQRDYEATPFEFFEDYDGFATGDVDPVTVEQVADGALKAYDNAVVIHDYTPEGRAMKGAPGGAYTDALDEFVDDGGNLVVTDTGTYLLAQLDNDLVDGSAIDRTENVTRSFYDVARYTSKNLDHPLLTDARPIQEQLWKVQPLGYAVSGQAQMDLVDEAAFTDAANDSVASVAARTDGLVATGSFTPDETTGTGVHYVSSLLPPGKQENLHPFGLQSYTVTFLGNLVLTSALGFEQVRSAGETTRRYGRGDEWEVDDIGGGVDLSVTGSRETDSSVDFGERTRRVRLTVDSVDTGAGSVEVRDRFPDSWNFLGAYSDGTSPEGESYVTFEGETTDPAELEGTTFTYFIETPSGVENSGTYSVGPGEALTLGTEEQATDEFAGTDDVFIAGVDQI